MGDNRRVNSTTNTGTKTVQNEDGTVTVTIATITVEEFEDGSKTTSRTENTTTEASYTHAGKNPLKKSERKKNNPVSGESDYGGIGTASQREALKAHNNYRARHGASPLELDQNLCNVAQGWANRLAQQGSMYHSNNGYGENIYMTSTQSDNLVPAVDAWYSEISMYNFGNPGFSAATGHFTQVVWKSTKRLGIAHAGGPNGTYVVANYEPAGNFQGQFPANVQPGR